MRSKPYTILAAIVWTVTTSPGDAGDWPGWFGSGRDGISEERNWNTRWEAVPPSVLWRAELGIGFSSFAVSGGRVFSMGNQDGMETVYCFSDTTGRLLWKHAYPAKLVDYLHEGGPSATPSVSNGLVYTLGKEGRLSALSVSDGTPAWEIDTRKAFGGKMPDCGFACSPLITHDKVVVDVGPIVAVDAKTGRVVWKTKVYDAGYGSAMAFTHRGHVLLGKLNNNGLVILDPADGTVFSLYPWVTQYKTNATTPIYHHEFLFISTAYNRGCTLLRLDTDLSMRPVYENKVMRNQMANCILHRGHLYGFDRKANPRRLVNLKCMTFRTGEEKWACNVLGAGSMILAGDHFLALSDEGELVLIEPSPEAYREMARFRILDGKCWTSPALSNGLLYARNVAGNMVCVDLRTAR